MTRVDMAPLVYCVVALVAALSLVIGARGLGPLDDHHMFRTLFQGKSFGVYIAPEIGRFFPLTAQEYVLASKLFHPSAELFYLINASKLVFCGVALFACLAMVRARALTIIVLWSVVVFCVGVANTLYRLSAGELNLLCAMLCVAWSALYVDSVEAEGRKHAMGVTIFAVAVFVASLFYKELAFLFGLTLGSAEFIRRMRVRRGRPPALYIGLVATGVAYIAFYGIWRVTSATGSYADLHAIPRMAIFAQFAQSDPFLLFVAAPIATWRFFVVVARPDRHALSDSLLVTSVVYVASYFALDIVSPYYLLPAYAFATVGVAGVITATSVRPVRALLVVASGLACLNTLPVFVSDVLRQKQVANNHFRFVHDLATWLKNNPKTGESATRNLVLEGVSPGGDIEIIESLRIYLSALGVPESTFAVIGSEPSNNAGLSALFKVQSVNGYKARVGDLEIFNPYQSVPGHVLPNSPSYPLVVGASEYLLVPRWSVLQWGQFCFVRLSDCAATLEGTRANIGYSAYLFSREPRTADLKPLTSREYRLLQATFPLSVEAGTTIRTTVTVENTGNEGWPADGRLQSGMYVHLAYRWFDESGAQVMEGDRSALPEAVFPREAATVSMIVKSPKTRGRYRLQIGPVQEGVAWFDGDPGRWVSVF